MHIVGNLVSNYKHLSCQRWCIQAMEVSVTDTLASSDDSDMASSLCDSDKMTSLSSDIG